MTKATSVRPAAKRPIVTRYVLDSSALLAVLFLEEGGDLVADVLGHAVISAVNMAETITKLVDRGMTLSKAAHAVRIFQMQVEPFDEHLAVSAAALRAPTAKIGLSLGDRACVAVAQKLNMPIMTADTIWAKLDIGVEVKLIR